MLFIAAYVAVPIIAESMIRAKILNNPNSTVSTISTTWSGPQTISGLHIEEDGLLADVDVILSESLFELMRPSPHIHIDVKGNAVLDLSPTREEVDIPNTNEMSRGSFSIPNLTLSASLNSLTIEGLEGDAPFIIQNLQGELLIDPGRHLGASLHATSDTGGSIEIVANAPDILNSDGTLNWDASGECNISIENMVLPTISGQEGWSIIELSADVSSPRLRDAINVSSAGSFAEYDEPKGYFVIKTQFSSAEKANGTFVFDDGEIVGSVNLSEVPTTLFAPLLYRYEIDPVLDIGKTVNLTLERAIGGPQMNVTFNSERIHATGVIDSGFETLSEVQLNANVRQELVRLLSENQLDGSAEISLMLERFVFVEKDENPVECWGNIEARGSLVHLPSKTPIQKIDATFSGNLNERKLKAGGQITLADQPSSFQVEMVSTNKNKLHSLSDLFVTIVHQLPKGSGRLQINNLPTKVVSPYIPEEQQPLLQYIGPIASSVVTFVRDGIDVEVTSKSSSLAGTLNFKDDTVESITDASVQVQLSGAQASSLLGVPVQSDSVLTSNIKSLDMHGNASFTLLYDIGKQRTFVEGITTRTKEGALDGHLAATGIDTRLLDAILECDGLLYDTIGSPIAVEMKVTNILDAPLIVAGGNSPLAAFETSLGLSNEAIFTIPDVPTQTSIQLSPSLTQHLLKDLGPILSDIRSVKHPVDIQFVNVQSSLKGDVSSLNADVYINIGEVELDSGSLTMKLLPMFNSEHAEVIPATFDPIHIEVRNGIAMYKKFSLTLDNKYSIPYSGSINFVTRALELHTAVPLTGLGYSIKELRGLATDIDVPILITGTIDRPVTKVDPTFDLSKILQSAAITAIGDAIGDALEGGNQDAPNPLDLLDELFGGQQ